MPSGKHALLPTTPISVRLVSDLLELLEKFIKDVQDIKINPRSEKQCGSEMKNKDTLFAFKWSKGSVTLLSKRISLTS